MKKQKNTLCAVVILGLCILVSFSFHLQHEKELRQIETIEKFGFYYVWFYYERAVYPIQGFSIEVTKEQLRNLSVLRQIVAETTIPLSLTDSIKTIFESKIIERVTIEATSGICAARAFVKRDGELTKVICLEPLSMINLFIILVYRRNPIPDFYAKASLFEDIKRERLFYIHE
ncbi:MAG: hypothetical protein A3J54_00730 [Candidatus Ryanbacteria bacterium RIFCSPHIGHO2_02_FULL_45_13b]|uniref:Uncharacterized protein n=1 Tax=Candidatus Ryanbacteria bacterium RIFCSPHIGHO2_02_FULL_45_13b TaxID=1802117 RepID=A0A1G2G4I0_9BACT|nr:MAG: hypothetical protein A3J54_00730 [Candidatus Ryanbacteria bacterium RIFCSPHIGHO2_02_FULL_45_13b]